MARYAEHPERGQSRGTGQGRYEQLRGPGGGGAMAAAMIMGAMLVISIILTVTAWGSRSNLANEYNALRKQLDDKKMENIQTERDVHHEENRMKPVVVAGCNGCLQLKTQLDGAKHELRNAYAKMSAKQIDEVTYNYDVVAKNVVLDYVADPANAEQQLIQISFTVKNQSVEPRGNILGLFRLYKEKDMVWQTKFKVAALAPGATTYLQFLAPGATDWNEWGCQLYPSVPSDTTKLPRQ